MLGGLIADTLKIFLSDSNVMTVLVVTMITITLLLIITDLFRRRW